MSDRDQYFGESGFVDATDEALDESREDTVSAPAYSQEEPAQPEVEPPQTQIAVDVADLEWLPVSDREESYSGDAPLAAPHEPAETKPRRSDFFDRNAAAASRALFGQGGRGASSSGSLGNDVGMKRGLTVSELARQASKTRVITPEPPPQKSLSSIPSKREYPKMLSLLQSETPEPIESRATEPAPYVPGTFFPNKPARVLVPDDGPPDVDGLLSAMADGLLIGEGEDGSSQILVTLRDDYFRGTELRVSIDDGQITAILVPPDYEVYRHLSSEIHRLEDQLLQRGLKVTQVTVQKP